MKKKFCVLTLLAVTCLGVYGCQSGKDVVERDSVLANQANNYYARGRFSQATEKYRELVDEHPDSVFRRQAILSLADSLYKDKSYFEAVLYYERFIQLYPLDPLTPRAQFYLAMSYYHDTTTMDRDQTNTAKTLEAFEIFLTKYPKHILVPYVNEKKSDMSQLRIESMLDIARFYHRVNRNQSAITRLKEFLELYPNSKEAPEALFLLADCYKSEQSFKNAALAYTGLIKKYPDSQYASDASSEAEKLKLKQ